jgi:ssDNA-binding Zn-finger/Zn-ribbon topoisomerase 1
MECLHYGYHSEADSIEEICSECGKENMVTQNNFMKCDICGKDLVPDDDNGYGAVFSEKGDLVGVTQILEAYYTDVNSIAVEDRDIFDFYHSDCLRSAIKISRFLRKERES